VISFRSFSPPAATESASHIAVDALIHRGELASLELAEAKEFCIKTGVMIGISVAMVLLGGIAGTFALAAAVWNRPDRGMILGLVAIGYLLVSGGFAFFAARRLKAWRPFEETTKQLREDCTCIQDIISDATQ
jgi:uncharacterized membrane protein YqjE